MRHMLQNQLGGGGTGLLAAFCLVWMLTLAVPVVGTVGGLSGGPNRTALPQYRIPALANRGDYVWPVWGEVTSQFGWRLAPDHPGGEFHAGVDVAAEKGAPVRAAAAGTVAFVEWGGNYGNLVILSHQGPDGPFQTWYGHLMASAVRVGAVVEAGELVGRVGFTGRSTGPHLHFEYRVDGAPVDPYRLYQ